VTDYAVYWTPGSVSRLQTLRYECCNFSPPPLSILDALLCEASGLNVLHIDLKRGEDVSLLEGSTGSAIGLPALLKLSLRCGVQIGAYLMQHLITPSCEEYSVELAFDPDSEETDVELIRQRDIHLISSFNAIIASATGASLNFNVQPDCMSMRLGGVSQGRHKHYIRLSVSETLHPHLYFLNLIQHLELSPTSLASIHLALHRQDMWPMNHTLDLSNKLAPIDHLYLDRVSSCDDFLDSLSHEVLAESPGRHWLFPSLNTLSLLSLRINPDTLVSIVQNRLAEANRQGHVQRLWKVIVERCENVTSDHLDIIGALGDIQVEDYVPGTWEPW
jgi:hypothetical protein